MGLFDNLVKSVSDLVKTKEAQKIKDNLKDIAKNVNNNENTYGGKEKSIPEEYRHFPAFNGKISDLITKKEEKYKRCSMEYYDATQDEIDDYIKQIENLGWEKKTAVRYEKDNEYIIVDNNTYSYLNIVFHVKF